MAATFHEMNEEELTKQLEAARAELRQLRFTYAVARSLPNPARVGKLRKDVARILTVQQARKLGKATQVEKSAKGAKPAKTAAPAKAEKSEGKKKAQPKKGKAGK